jgi:hypothetical protein
MNQSSDRALTRRTMFRLLGGAALAAVPALRLAEEATAGRTWCRADPVLRIGGQTAHVYITSPVEMLKSATDKIMLRVTLPRGVEGKLTDILADFGRGYDVRFATSSALTAVDGVIPVQLAVSCPARDATLPVTVEFAPVGDGPLVSAAASGTANAWITLVAR